jgi:hypothetical protein
MNIAVALVLGASAIIMAQPCASHEGSAPAASVAGPGERAGDGAAVTLDQLAGVDRFGWPARFTCRRAPGDRHPFSIVAANPDDMNARLVAADLWPSDCHGGFVLRSVHPQHGKLERIVGKVVPEAGDGEPVSASGSSVANAVKQSP